MSNRKKRNSGRIAAQIAVGIGTLICYGIATWLQGLTLVRWWIPLLICAMVGLASGVPLAGQWRKLTATSVRWINMIVHGVVVAGVLLALVLGANRVFAHAEATRRVEVRVERKYIETHYRTKRVGRRYTRGEPYPAYYMEVAFPTGQRKSFMIQPGEYRRLRPGASLHLEVEPGFLGMPVVLRAPRVSESGQVSARTVSL